MTEGEETPQSEESDQEDLPPGSIYSVPVTGEKGEDASQTGSSGEAKDTASPAQE
jgi:hypothetical protein